MKKYIKICTVFIVILICNSLYANLSVINPQLENRLRYADKEEFIRINIVFKEQYDFEKLLNNAIQLDKENRRNYVIEELSKFSMDTQDDVLDILRDYSNENKVKEINSLWVANVINCYATPQVIKLLSNRKEIAELDHDESRKVISADYGDQNILLSENKSSKEVTWNVLKINADDVWALGYTGEGLLVAVIDTGVNYNHTDLADHLWCHPDYPYHGYDFHNNDYNPIDDNGHGTHCAGTVAGDGTSGSQTGVAPDAEIMCLKVLNSGGSGYESNSWDALQFSITNGVNIISMSLGWLHAWNPNRTVWRNTYNNLLAAGMIAAVSAGNEGDDLWMYPIPDNIRTPGDCPPPWLHPDQTLIGGNSSVISVGATDSGDNIADFSSRGPVTWESIAPFYDYPYNPEMGLIRPDIVAPGVSIKSLSYTNNTGYVNGPIWSGTSMSAPCIAGTMALMLSKNNNLSPENVDQYIEENAFPLSTSKSNTYGSGRVDALEAVNATPLPNPIFFLEPTSIDFGEVEVGNDTTAQFMLKNEGGGNLSGFITAPEGYFVSESKQKSYLKNQISYCLDCGESQTYDLTFAPTEETCYDNQVLISQDPFFMHYLNVYGEGIIITDISQENIYQSIDLIGNYPNPAKNYTTIIYDNFNSKLNKQFVIQLYNIKGKLIKEEICTGNYKEMDISELSSGIYFYRIKNKENGKIKKMIILD